MKKLLESDLVFSRSASLTQIALTVLPIGIGASGYLFLQDQSIATTVSLILVWLGLVMLAVVIFINLNTFRTKNPSNIEEKNKLNKRFNCAIIFFVIGTIFLITAPIGFAASALFTKEPQIEFDLSSDLITSKANNQLVEYIFVSSFRFSDVSFSKAGINHTVTPDNCIEITGGNSNVTPKLNEIGLLDWILRINPECAIGDYVVLFTVTDGDEILAEEQLLVHIIPQE